MVGTVVVVVGICGVLMASVFGAVKACGYMEIKDDEE